MSSKTDELRQMHQTLLDGGATGRQAGLMTFPELPADSAAVQMQGLSEPRNIVIGDAGPERVTRDLFMTNAQRRMISEGATQDTAYTIAAEAATAVPQSTIVADVLQVADYVNRKRTDISAGATERALSANGVLDDIRFIATSAQVLIGTAQQGLNSVMIDEHPMDTAVRMWPTADIREADGVVRSKALVPKAIKGLMLSFSALVSGVVHPGGAQSALLRGAAQQYVTELATSDYIDSDILTGQEVIEHWMSQGNIVAHNEWLPRMDTPEREAYDTEVADNAARNYATMMTKRGGGMAMFGVATGGALMDVFVDPLPLMSALPVRGTRALRALVPVTTRARITAGIASRTRRLPDIVRAVDDAKKWVDKSADMYKADPTDANKARLDHAQRTLVRNNELMELVSEADIETMVLPVGPRIHPDHVEPVADVFLSTPLKSRAAVTRRTIGKQVREVGRKIKTIEKRLERGGKAVPDRGGKQELLEKLANGDISGSEYLKRWKRLEADTKAAGRGTGTSRPAKRLSDDIAKQLEDIEKLPTDERIAAKQDLLRQVGDDVDSIKVDADAAPVTAPEDLAKVRQADMDRLAALRESRDQWKGTLRWFNNRMKNPASRTAAFLKRKVSDSVPYKADSLEFAAKTKTATKLKDIQHNIERLMSQADELEAKGIDVEQHILQWERTYTNVQNGTDNAIGQVLRSTETTDDIVRSARDAQRRKVLSDPDELTPVRDYSDADPEQLRQRIAHGPDQREAASEAARGLAAGLEIDDIAFHGVGVELYNTSYGRRLRPRSGTEQRAARALTEKELATEAEWLGIDAFETKIEAAAWQQSMAEKMGDMYGRGLYPETWNLRATGLLNGIREPMRVLQSINPRLYTRVHDAVRAQEFEMMRMTEFFSNELAALGVYKKVKGAFVLNPENSKKFYQIMNMDPTRNEYSKALSALTETERRSVRRIRQELDFVADKLGLRDSDRFIEGYIDHVFDRRFGEAARADMTQRAGLGSTTDVFNPHMIERKGMTGYKEDLALSLDSYVRGATRKLHLEPLFEDLHHAAELHVKSQPGDVWFKNYIDDMVNNLKGQPSTMGQWVDRSLASMNARMSAYAKMQAAGRQAGTALEKLGGPVEKTGRIVSKLPGKAGKLGGAIESEGVRISEFGSQMALDGFPVYNTGDASRTALAMTALSYASVLGGSGRYFPMAVATGLATTGSRFGVMNTARGILAMGTKEGRTLAKATGLERQWIQIMEDAAWTKMGKLAANMPSFNGVTVVGPSISSTENMIRGWTFHASMGDLMRKQGFAGWDEVVEAGLANAYLHEGLRTTEEVNHLFGQLGKPPSFNRVSKSGSAASTQFLSFIPKQTEELMAQTLKNPGRIMQYMMISGYMQRVAAKVGLDISDYVGMGFLPKSPDEAQSIVTETVRTFMVMNGEMAKFWGDGRTTADAQATFLASQAFLRNLQNFIPIGMAAQRFTRGTTTLYEGAHLDSRKDLSRTADLGQFKWDKTKSVGANLTQLPRGLFSASGDPAQPTELSAILTGMKSTQQDLARISYNSLREQANTIQFRRGQIADSLDEAIKTGSTDEFSRQMQRAVDEGMLMPDIKAMIEQQGMEMAVPQLMRLQMRSEQMMLKSVDVMIRERAEYRAKFGR